MNVLVIGATGGSGRAALEALLAAGHHVTAFARGASRLQGLSPHLRCVDGDATKPADIDRVVPAHDAVVVTLGIHENALTVRLRGPRATPMDVRSAGTRHVIDAMRRHGVRRLVVQSSYGVGETRERLPFVERLVFRLLLAPQIADTERQEALVRDSGLDWVLVQPVNLTDSLVDTPAHASADGDTQGMKVARRQVGRFLAGAITGPAWLHRAVALSAA